MTITSSVQTTTPAKPEILPHPPAQPEIPMPQPAEPEVPAQPIPPEMPTHIPQAQGRKGMAAYLPYPN